jgi:transcription antitermination factor NusG
VSSVFSSTRVTAVTTIRRVRRLPPGGVPKVALSQPVKALDVVAVAELPGNFRVLKLDQQLSTDAHYAETCMIKRLGDPVRKGETLALRSVSLGLRKLRVVSPIDGRIMQIENGQVIVEGERKRQEIYASVPGKVVAIEVGEHVIIETNAAQIQIAWGMGGLAWGTLKVMDSEPGLITDAKRFNIDHRGAIVVIGSPITEDLLKAAIEIRVKGLVGSSMHSSLVPLLSKIEFPVGLTQGFGALPMSERVLGLLNTYNGREIAMDMSFSPDWRDMRPEIIIPVTSAQGSSEDRSADQYEFRVGQKARVLQSPFLGEIGTVTELPEEVSQLESGLWASGAQIQMTTGETIFVPFANLEYLG